MEYVLEGASPRVTGRAVIYGGRTEGMWTFALLLPRPPKAFRSRGEIDWASLLPAKGMTCWISFDEERRQLEIEPGVARADLL